MMELIRFGLPIVGEEEPDSFEIYMRSKKLYAPFNIINFGTRTETFYVLPLDSIYSKRDSVASLGMSWASTSKSIFLIPLF
jgi:hypothetical protein